MGENTAVGSGGREPRKGRGGERGVKASTERVGEKAAVERGDKGGGGDGVLKGREER